MTLYRLAEHQQYAEFMMECNDALGIFYEAGTGKTMIALSYCYHALERGEAEDVLVVCPASLVPSWNRAVDKMLEFEGYLPKDVEFLRSRMTVISYQKVYKSARATGKKAVELRDNINKHWSIIIVDEAHGLGGHSTLQTRACLKLAELGDRRYALTGTPVSGGGGRPDYQKLYGIMKFLHPDIWKTWSEFCAKYVTKMDKWFKPIGYDDAKCEKLMRENAIMCRLRDVYDDMPAETHDVIECTLSEKEVYSDLRKLKVEKYGIELRTAGGIYTKLLQVCSGSLSNDETTVELHTNKDQALKTLLEGTNDSVVIFCNYSASVDRCATVAKRCGRIVVRYDGRAKDDAWMDFQYGKADCIICQYQKGGVGIDLFKSATMIYFEPCWSSMLLEQSKARIMRKGQTRPCRFLYLCTPNTREADAWNAVRNGVDLTSDLFERWAQEEKY